MQLRLRPRTLRHFPSDSAADAVRFSITSDAAGLIRFVYIVEKDHSPTQHGILEYATSEARVDASDASHLLLSQAQAFLESYLRRKSHKDQ